MELDFTQTLTLLLVGLLFAKDTLLPWIGEKVFGIKRDSEPVNHHYGHQDTDQGTRIESAMGDLQMHFNHETTAQNGEVIVLLKEIREQQSNICRKSDRIIVLLENQDKYGVKTRRE